MLRSGGSGQAGELSAAGRCAGVDPPSKPGSGSSITFPRLAAAEPTLLVGFRRDHVQHTARSLLCKLYQVILSLDCRGGIGMNVLDVSLYRRNVLFLIYQV